MRAQAVHQEMMLVRRRHRRAEARLAVLLVEMDDDRLWESLGYSSVVHYAEVELDMPPRQTIEMTRTGRRMRALPGLRAAFEDGALGWTKAREVARVATEETDAAWVQRALETTSRELERQVAATRPGAPPPDGDCLGPARRRVSFEMEAADAEVLFRALRVLRVQGEADDGEVDDGALLAALAQRALADMPADSEAVPPERFRVVLQRCPECLRTAVTDGPVTAANDDGETHVGQSSVSPALADQACCDAEVVTLRRDGTSRLSRTIPPATRRAVMARDHFRCAVPYCRSRLWLDVHHVRPRAAGGTHDPTNLICVCPAHHRAIHEYLLIVGWDGGTGRLVFERPDGRHFGPSNSGPTWAGEEELGRQDALVSQVMEVLSRGSALSRDISSETGVDFRRIERLLLVMRGAGLVTRGVDWRWSRTGDSWEGAGAAGSGRDAA